MKENHKYDKYLIPIVIGATGHIKIHRDYVKKVKEQVECVVDEILSKYCNEKVSTPLVLLSALAEGADRIIANKALEKGIKLIVVLPMPQNEYIRDFESKDSIDKFNDIIKKAHKVIDLTDISGMNKTNIVDREPYYEYLAKYIALHSQILIALWNQNEKKDLTGSYQVVKYMKEGINDNIISIDDIAECGEVYEIYTPKEGEKIQKEIKYTVEYPKLGDSSEEYSKNIFENCLKKICEYNQEIKSIGDKLHSQIEQGKYDLISDKDQVNSLKHETKDLLTKFAIADAFTKKYQTTRRNSIVIMSGLLILAVTFYNIYSNMKPYWLLLFMYPIIMTAGAAYNKFRTKDTVHEKYLEYRLLAEAMRIQLFWYMSGLKDNVTDFYLNQHKNEFAWIRIALRGVNLAKVTESKKDAIGMVKTYWLMAQQGYYKNKIQEHVRFINKQNKRIDILYYVGLFISVALAIADYKSVKMDTLLHGFIVFLIGMAAPFISSMINYLEIRSFNTITKRYNWMNKRYDKCITKLDEAINKNDNTSVGKIIKEIGIEALEENQDWMMLFIERAPEMSKS